MCLWASLQRCPDFQPLFRPSEVSFLNVWRTKLYQAGGANIAEANNGSIRYGARSACSNLVQGHQCLSAGESMRRPSSLYGIQASPFLYCSIGFVLSLSMKTIES
jgi:hypothetical protein